MAGVNRISRAIANSVNSVTFWYCIKHSTLDAIDIISIILEISALLLNSIVGVLLLRIHEGNRVSIALLRTAILTSIIDVTIKLIEELNPTRVNFSNFTFNYFICIIWDSRFLYWLFNTIAIEAIVFFAIDRAITLRGRGFFSLLTTESRLKTYQIVIYVYSLAITIPQFFSVNLVDGGCNCAPSTQNIPFLAIIYAHVFIRFVLLVLLNGTIFIFCSAVVIQWVRETPIKHQIDELAFLHFGKPSEAEVKRFESQHGWKTPSLCIIPLGLCFIITFGFDATYQFFSGTGVVTYVIGGPVQRAGTLMLAVFSNFLPVVLLLTLPVLRFRMEDVGSQVLRWLRGEKTGHSTGREDDKP